MRRAPNWRTQRPGVLEAADRGALFHPHPNWFLNASHDGAFDDAISIAAEVFRATCGGAKLIRIRGRLW
jgi:hypothetical protein